MANIDIKVMVNHVARQFKMEAEEVDVDVKRLTYKSN